MHSAHLHWALLKCKGRACWLGRPHNPVPRPKIHLLRRPSRRFHNCGSGWDMPSFKWSQEIECFQLAHSICFSSYQESPPDLPWVQNIPEIVIQILEYLLPQGVGIQSALDWQVSFRTRSGPRYPDGPSYLGLTTFSIQSLLDLDLVPRVWEERVWETEVIG